MRVLIRRVGVLAALVASIAVLGPARASAVSAGGGGAGGTAAIDGVAFQLPAGLGQRSDFTYDYDDVDFVSAVWETGPDADGGYRVDLNADVMHGDRLRSAAALHDWFIDYNDRPPAEARYVPVRVHGHPGWLCRDELFWLVRPGMAIAVELDRARWTRQDVVRLAASARVVTPVG